jgi:hypothetical protein
MEWVETGIGHIPTQPFKPNAQGKFDDADVMRAVATVQAIAGLLNGGIRIGTGAANSQAGNLSGGLLKLVFGTANTEIKLPHGLHRVPIGFVPLFKDRACDVYSSRGAALAWGDESMAYFTCNTASAVVVGLLL